MEDREYLNSWVFYFNPFTENWYAIPRDHYLEFFQNSKTPHALKSSSINTLLEILHKVKGDSSLVKSLVK